MLAHPKLFPSIEIAKCVIFSECFSEIFKIEDTEKAVKTGVNGALEGSRTPNRLVRSQVLYPVELRARNVFTSKSGCIMRISDRLVNNFFKKNIPYY